MTILIIITTIAVGFLFSMCLFIAASDADDQMEKIMRSMMEKCDEQIPN